MKKIMLFVLALCLCFTAVGAAFAETAVTETPAGLFGQEDCGYEGGLSVVISAPAGVEIAKKTFNPRLGIVGGISILGTTGIVEPMSDEAVIETIRAELSMRAAAGKKAVLFVPGNYGADFIQNELGLDPLVAVTVSNPTAVVSIDAVRPIVCS